MKRRKPASLVGLLIIAVIVAPRPAPAQASDPGSKKIAELEAQVDRQTRQIEQLRLALDEQKKLLLSITNASGQRTPLETEHLQDASAGEVASTVPMAPAVSPMPARGPVVPQNPPQAIGPSQNAPEKSATSALSFRIGDADFTPLGFMDFTLYTRSTNLGSGIGTSFGGIPFTNSVAGQLPETRLSAQNSRVGLRIDTTVKGAKVLGYLETDFLGFSPTNIAVTSNSDTLRMRLYWVDLTKGQFEILAGQSWSMMTPNRKALSALPSDLFYSQDVDTNYQVGLTWSRDPQFRLIWHPNTNISWGVSLESPEQYVGGAVTFPTALAGAYGGELNTGANTLTVPNLHPDIVSKIAFDCSPGDHAVHFEVAGLYRTFRVYNPLTSQHFNKPAGGGSLNFNIELLKGFHVIANQFVSDGGGRYIFGLGPDLIIRPNGDISPIHAASTLDGVEFSVSPRTLLYGYYGGAYYGRNVTIDTNGKPIGFGYTGSSNSSNRAIQEITGGLVQTIWRNPSYGALQFMFQYSYLTRNAWFVAAGAPTDAREHIVYANLRYVLP